MSNEKIRDVEVEELQELLQASLRELSAILPGVPPPASAAEGGLIARSATQVMEKIEAQHQNVVASLARFNVGVQASFKRLSSSKKTTFIKKLAAHGTTQNRIATLLGMTQSAVSQHLNKRSKNSAHRLERIARIDALLNAGASNAVVLAMLEEQGVAVDAASLATFLKVYLQIANAEV